MEIIHFLLGKANPERMNGVNKVVHELAAHQAGAGVRVRVWGLANDLEHNYPSRNYTTELFRQQRNAFRLPQELAAALEGIEDDVVFHLHGGFIPQMYRFSKLLRQKGVPFVFTPHGSYNVLAMKKRSFFKKWYRLFFERPMLKRAKWIHVLGESEELSLLHWDKTLPVRRIPYGFDPAPARQLTSRENRASFVVGYCGRIDIHTKGLDALLQGFALFYKNHPDSELQIIGDGREMDRLREMIQGNSVAKAVTLYGARYGAEKDALLQQFDVFAHPSRNEGLPSAVLEAAAAGIPCLVTRATNTADAVGACRAGAVIGDAEAAAIAAALGDLYAQTADDASAAALKQNATMMVRSFYDWPTLLQTYQELYQKALL